MNRHSVILTVTTLSLLASPPASRADASVQAMHACVQAFVAANLPKEQRVVVDKQNIVSGPLDAHSRTYTVNLAAIGATSGRQIAKAICVADRNGEVIRLNGRRPSQLVQTASATNDLNKAR